VLVSLYIYERFDTKESSLNFVPLHFSSSNQAVLDHFVAVYVNKLNRITFTVELEEMGLNGATMKIFGTSIYVRHHPHSRYLYLTCSNRSLLILHYSTFPTCPVE
jgi:hypothetical protein